MRKISARDIEVAETALDIGVDNAAAKLGIKRETVRRRVRLYKKEKGATGGKKPNEGLLSKIADRYSDAELRAIASGGLHDKIDERKNYCFDGKTVTLGVITDTHIGSKYTHPDRLPAAFEIFDRYMVDMVFHCGDVFEGLSNRPDHVYECTQIGYDAQLEEGRRVFSEWTQTPVHVIAGNHDLWYKKSSGANIVRELCGGQENLIYEGDHEGDVYIDGACLRLWHGNDAGSYAHSYRLQKLIESFTGGEKPNALFAGHVHKSLYSFDRHVHCLSAGSMQSQSGWMRSKRLPSHTGFWVVVLEIDDSGISRFAPEWFPFYE